MTKTSLVSAVLLSVAMTVGAASESTRLPFESASAPVSRNKIDELVFSRLKALRIEPANPCSDAVFLRRAYLDVIGTLPKADEARTFLEDSRPNKRALLVDRLLQRDEFADYWAMKWSDVLRVKSEFPINLWPNAVQAYHRWIRTSVKENLPYDQFVRQLLASSGSNFRVPQVNFYRALQGKEPQAIAQAVALAFMGTRTEKWPTNQWTVMADFFSVIGRKYTSEWKEEIIFFDVEKAGALASTNAAQMFVFPDGKKARRSPDMDPRQAFADWLTAPDNPWFARAAVNRIWAWLFGRGIVEEPDDIRPDNPPSNQELLTYLEKELVAAHFDLKQVYRLILNSQVYQLSPIPKSDTPEAAANFARYPVRRLDAEVLIDAINQITGGTEQYSSAIPEPFTYVPEVERTIALADASITSPFLEMFGRPPRDTGLALERNNRPTADQRLHMLNSTHIQSKLQQSAPLRTLMQSNPNPMRLVNALYLTVLSRLPTNEESAAAIKFFQASAGNPWPATVDLAWALINTAEFLYRH